MIKVVTQINSRSIWCQSQQVLVRTFWGPQFYKRLTQNFFCEHGMYVFWSGSESLLTSFSVMSNLNLQYWIGSKYILLYQYQKRIYVYWQTCCENTFSHMCHIMWHIFEYPCCSIMKQFVTTYALEKVHFLNEKYNPYEID